MAELELPGIDTRGWTKAGSSGMGGYYLASTDVLVAVPPPGHIQTEENARRSLAEFNRIAESTGRRMAVIVLVDLVKSQDAASRRVWSAPQERNLRCALALVCASALSRAIGSFFIGLNRPACPTKMFATYEQALSWTREMVETHGGPL
jgi:hypothetical protein